MIALRSTTVTVSNDIAAIRDATHIILPGVGAFGSAMAKIRARIPLEVLEEEVLQKGKPFLGVCVGMQVLAAKGFEFGEHAGLGWLKGEVCQLKSGDLPLPHIGWNDIDIIRPAVFFSSFKGRPDFYFLHSYCFVDYDPADLIATCTYGQTFPCALGRNNVFGVQFHPEKSQRTGRAFIDGFLRLT